jgi:hypothetical protein
MRKKIIPFALYWTYWVVGQVLVFRNPFIESSFGGVIFGLGAVFVLPKYLKIELFAGKTIPKRLRSNAYKIDLKHW